MTPEEHVKQLIESVGAVVEFLKIFYDKLIDQGFDTWQAMALTEKFLEVTLGQVRGHDDP